MLMKLLNNKPESSESCKGTELLHQLLNNNTEEESTPRPLKRPLDEEPLKPGTSRGNAPGDLCRKNPRLHSLLQTRPEQPVRIPQVCRQPLAFFHVTKLMREINFVYDLTDTFVAHHERSERETEANLKGQSTLVATASTSTCTFPARYVNGV